MNITDVRIRRMGEEGKMKAVASVTFDDEFVFTTSRLLMGRTDSLSLGRAVRSVRVISVMLHTL